MSEFLRKELSLSGLTRDSVVKTLKHTWLFHAEVVQFYTIEVLQNLFQDYPDDIEFLLTRSFEEILPKLE